MSAWSGESDRFVTREEDTWVGKPKENALEVEYETNNDVSEDFLEGIVTVLDEVAKFMRDTVDAEFIKSLADTYREELKNMKK